MTRSAQLSPAQRALLARLAKGDPAAARPAIPRVAGDGPFPMSYAQDRIWFTSQLAPDVRLYNLMGGIRLPGTLDLGELERRLAAAIRRHDALRMSVQIVDDEPRLAVAPSVPAVVQPIDLSWADPADADALAQQTVLDVAAAPYQLGRAPLWRLALVTLPGGEQMLVIGAHHLVMDGLSLSLFGHELLAPAGRGEPPIRYVDFAAWKKSLVASGGVAAEREYWRQQLAGLPPPLDLAFGRRPARRSLRGATLATDVPDRMLRRIRELSQEQGTTPYSTLLAAFAALLHRYTGSGDILVGTLVSGRTMPELYNLIGMFVNMLPLRIRLAGRPAFGELLAQTKQVLADALARQNVPFELLVNDLRLGGVRDHPPLVQVGFNMPMAELPSEVRVVDIPFTAEGSQLDLTVHVQSLGGDGFQLLFEYASDLFGEQTIQAMIDRYLFVLEELITDPERTVAEVPLLTPAERAVLAAGRGPVPGNAADSGTAPQAPLHVLVAGQARRTPEQTAVVSGEQSLTYATLDERAAALAAELRRRGVAAETPVGVLVRPGLDLAVALLAVWKAGGAFVPLDPDQPRVRAELIMADTAAPVLLTQRDLAGWLPGGAHQVVCVEDVPAGPAPSAGRAGPASPGVPGDPAPSAVPAVPAGLGNAAYVIYTSGSTGRPKGVVITHGGIANRVLWAVRAHGIGPADRVLHKTRLTFDASIWEIFAPLVSGGTVVMAPAGADRDPGVLLRAVAGHRVTVLQVVPSVLRLLAETGDWSGCTSLRLLFCAGEPLPGTLCARVAELTQAQIINTYGPTECSIDVTSARYVPGDRDGLVPIGRPIDNTRVLVLDASAEPVPAGLPGELYVGGAGPARGYLGRPGLTAAAFVADPYGPPGGRLYRTGDLARWRPDGELEFLGRRDLQVKVNGVRVEPAEIEAALTSHPDVGGAVVTAHDDGSGGRRLVAYVTGPAAGPELRAYLRERLPGPMVPGVFIALDAIPLTSSGKVDRAALPAPDRGARPDGSAYLAPRDHIEETIAEVWSDLLGAGPVGVHDDFFALGGHSLQLTRLAARLRTLLGANLTVADLFGAPTVAEQARLASAGRAGALEPIQPADRSRPLPLSPGQGRLWFLYQLDPCDIKYTVPITLRLTGELDVPALQAALDDVVARHEVLRTTIATGPDGTACQVIHPPAPVPLARADLTHLAIGEARTRAVSLLDADATRPFDLATGPVLRVQLIRLAPLEHVLGLTLHHIASDGWSAGVLRQELSVLYAGHHSGQPPQLPPLRIQYADYAAWQHRFLSGEQMRQQLGYWRTQLAGLPTVALPTDRPRPARISPAAAYCLARVPASTAGKLRGLGRLAGTSLFMTLLAGFQAFLARYAGQDDIAVGTAVAGRGHPETERLIGFFVNTLVLRTDLSGDPTVSALLARVREVTLGAYAHQDLPFEHLVEELKPVRDLSRHPLFQIMFEMVTQEPDAPLAGLEVAPLWEETRSRTAKFDLTVAMAEQDDGSLLGYVEYAADLFGQQTIERMLGHYVAVLTEFADDPGQRLSDIQMLSLAERQQLTEWATGPELLPAARDGGFAGEATGPELLPPARGGGFGAEATGPESRPAAGGGGYAEATSPESRPAAGGEGFAAETTGPELPTAARSGGIAAEPTIPLVPDLIAAQIRATPGTVALAAADRRVTYAELGSRAGLLARRLTACGVRPDTVVGLCLDDGIAFIVAAVAVLLAGGAYLPLDPGQPTERLRFMLSDTGAAVVLTTAGLRDRFAGGTGPAVIMAGDVTSETPAAGVAAVAGESAAAEVASAAGKDAAAEVASVADEDRAAEVTWVADEDGATEVALVGDQDVAAGVALAAGSVSGPRPGNTAYVIYTSGSTGSAKAVLVGHGALARSTAARQQFYQDPPGTFLLLSPVIFDSSVAGIFWTLCSGGTLLLPARGRKLVDEIAQDIAGQRVTHVVAVPSLLAQLADWQLRGSRPPLDSLRVIITAGEACPADLPAKLTAVAPGATLFNEYGPTEAGIWASVARLGPGQDAIPPIGRPIPGAVCHVLDSRLRLVPVGVPGELWLGGGALARGYAGHPARTAERFTANPLASDGSRLYRTGDLARWRPDGQLEYLGRIDDQVKLAGHRIEPGEIEATLREHPQVGAVAVVVTEPDGRPTVVTGPDGTPAVTGPDGTPVVTGADGTPTVVTGPDGTPVAVTEPDGRQGDPRLVAYFVAADPGRPPAAGELREHCEQRLPEYMFPASFECIDAMPVTATGKIDRAALAARRAGPGTVSAGERPRTDVEREVARVWCEVLGLDQIGVHDDFFKLGGHSLQAVRISTRLQELYDIELPLRRLFEATTVATLAAALEEAIKAEVAALSDDEIAALLAERESGDEQ